MNSFNPRRWGKTDLYTAGSAAANEKVTKKHLLVLNVMGAYVPKGSNISTIAQKWIGEALGYSQSTVHRLQQGLTTFGYVKPVNSKAGRRSQFEMLTPCYHEKVAVSEKNGAYQKKKPYEKKASAITATVKKAATNATREEIAEILAG